MGKEGKLILYIVVISALVVYGYNAWMSSQSTS